MYDSNGNWIDPSNITYDEFGNAYDTSTGLMISQNIAPNDVGTSYASNPYNVSTDTTGSSTLGNILGSLGTGIGNVMSSPVGSLAAGTLLGGLAGPSLNNILSGGAFNQAKGLINQGANMIQSVPGGNLTNLIPQLTLQVQNGLMTPAQAAAAYQQVIGQMNPAQAAAAQQGITNMAGVNSDQTTLAGAQQALDQLGQVAAGQGLTDADRAQLAATINQTNAAAAAQREAQIQQLQMQGNAGTGAELAARLSGGQQMANANAMAGANIAQQAQARALQAMQAGLSGNTNLNQQLFAQQAQKAQAQDLINQFNTAAQNTVNAQNAANLQAANQSNFNAAQTAAAQNAAAQNQMNALNAQNQQQANATNFAMGNQIGANNTNILNQQAMLPVNLQNQSFQNQLNQATNASKASLAGGQLLNQQGNIQAGASTALANAAANALSGGKTTSTGTTTAPAPAPSSGGSSNSGFGNVLGTIGSAIGNNIGDIASTVGSWFGFKDGGYVDGSQMTACPPPTDDYDKIMAELTGYKYRYKK